MIELRWLTFEGGHKVLQSRVKYDKTIYGLPAGIVPPEPHTERVWSEWCDVPQLMCAVVNGERKVIDRVL